MKKRANKPCWNKTDVKKTNPIYFILSVALLLAFALLLVQQTKSVPSAHENLSKEKISGKRYKSPYLFNGYRLEINFHENGTYTVCEFKTDSEMRGGIYVINREIVTLTEEGPYGNFINRFRIVGSTLFYIRNESTGFYHSREEKQLPTGLPLINENRWPVVNIFFATTTVSSILIHHKTKRKHEANRKT